MSNAAPFLRPRTALPALDAPLADLARSRDRWMRVSPAEKVALLERVQRDTRAVASEWAIACADAKGVARASREAGEEWVGVAFLLNALGLMRASLDDIARHGRPRIPGPVAPCGDRQLAVRVFPRTPYDRFFYPGLKIDVWTEPGVTRDQLDEEHAALHRRPPGQGKTVLVLGAGNYSILGPCDVLGKLFCEGAVVVYKTHPVTDYLTPLLERAFEALVAGGWLRIVRGGAEEGGYLAHHPLVDELHLTGSDRTYDAMVFGTGEEGRRRKTAGERLLTKRFTCELGNVSPAIVVPGPWNRSDLAYQGQHLAGMLVPNAAFNCLSTRVIVQHAGWSQRQALLDEVRGALAATPTRPAYYPGAREIHRRFVEAHPQAERFGAADGSRLPWTLVAGVDPARRDDPCFTTEAFCPLLAETALPAGDVPTFVERAVEFANHTLWGTLTCTVLVHPASLEDPRVAEAVERAVRELRYGTVAVNVWGMFSYMLMTGSWGAFPGHRPEDIQSGQGTVNNYLMIPRAQKTVARAPFRQRPKPLVFPNHRTALEMARRLADFYASPSWRKVPGVALAALRG